MDFTGDCSVGICDEVKTDYNNRHFVIAQQCSPQGKFFTIKKKRTTEYTVLSITSDIIIIKTILLTLREKNGDCEGVIVIMDGEKVTL